MKKNKFKKNDLTCELCGEYIFHGRLCRRCKGYVIRTHKSETAFLADLKDYYGIKRGSKNE